MVETMPEMDTDFNLENYHPVAICNVTAIIRIIWRLTHNRHFAFLIRRSKTDLEIFSMTAEFDDSTVWCNPFDSILLRVNRVKYYCSFQWRVIK